MEGETSNRKKVVQDVTQRRKHKRRNICLATTAAVILFIILVIVILALTVFKPKRPVITIDSMSIQDLHVSSGIVNPGVNINLTLLVDISVKNPNKVGFKYTNSSAFLNYRGQLVGEVPIPAGKISADQTVPMNLTLNLLADRLLSNSQIYSDALADTLSFNTFTRIPGKVSIFNVFKVRVISSSSCDFNVFVRNSSIGNQICHYKTKL